MVQFIIFIAILIDISSQSDSFLLESSQIRRQLQSCPTYYFKNTATNKCEKCDNCTRCPSLNAESSKVCKICSHNSYNLDLLADGTCGQLPPGVTFNVWASSYNGCDSTKCICNSGVCSGCKDPTQVVIQDMATCSECKGMRVMKASNCVECSTVYSNCYQCDSLQCLVCKQGFSLSNGACITCPSQNIVSGYCKDPSCKTLTTTSIQSELRIICDQCADSSNLKLLDGTCKSVCPNSYIAINGICESCQNYPDQCGICINSKVKLGNNCVTVDECFQNYGYPQNNICILCNASQGSFLQNCTGSVCQACGPCKLDEGYYLDSKNICQKCNNACKTCSNATSCNECWTSTQNPSNMCKCFSTATSKCLDCDLNSNSQCFTCSISSSAGQIDFTNSSCICSKNCSKNLTCPLNFYTNTLNNKCECMTDIKSCASCKINNGQLCDVCQSGYYLTALSSCMRIGQCFPGYTYDSTSQKCICNIENCDKCNDSDGTICDLCKVGSTFNSKLQKCVCNLLNCETCDPNNLFKCQTCATGYHLSNNSTCDKNIDNCTQYNINDSTKCDQCSSGQILNDTQIKCKKPCLIQNCKTCDEIEESKCVECNNYYDLSLNHLTCIKQPCQVSNCLECTFDSVTKCSQCLNQYQLSIEQTSCNQKPCQVLNCKTCISNDITKCQVCEDQYTVSASQCIKKPCSVLHCEKCLDEDYQKCQVCSSQYQLSSDNNFQCIQKPCQVQNCQQCQADDITKCIDCGTQFTINNDKTFCIKKPCSVSNCQKCQDDDYQKCETCNSIYELSTDKLQCIKKNCQVNNCKQCTIDSITNCQLCKDQYELSANSLYCIQKPCQVSNCQKCLDDDITKCQICASQYELSSNNTFICVQKSCQVQNCIQCVSNDITKCQDCGIQFDISVDSTQCIKKPCSVQNCDKCLDNDYQKCEQCNSIYDLSSDKSSCIKKSCQVNNCQECAKDSITQCKVCNDQYELSSNQLQCNQLPCQVSNCQQCKSNDITKCRVCSSQYELTSSQLCSKMPCQVANCLQCTFDDIFKCQNCGSQFDLSIDKTACTKKTCSVQNCFQCEHNDFQKCKVCKDIYQLSTDQSNCEKKLCQVQNCYQCKDDSITLCKFCKNQYQLSSDQSSCNQIPCQVDNCQKCESNDITKCEQCQSQYEKSIDSSSCQKKPCQVLNCQMCDSNDIQKCQLCGSQYNLSSDKIQCIQKPCSVSNCQNCKVNDYQKCETCLLMYEVNHDQTQCIKKQCQVQNCSKCLDNDINICEKCDDLYELNQKKQCQMKPCQVQNCQTCQQNSIYQCKTCNQQYELSSSFQCNKLKCQISNCKFCLDSDVYTCKECTDQFELSFDKKTCEQKPCQIQNCKICDQNDIFKCQECSDTHFYQLNIQKTECVKKQCKVNNCQECRDDNLEVCKTCSQTYTLNSNGLCLESCTVSNCLYCDSQNSSKCIKCNQNFTITPDGNCIKSIQNNLYPFSSHASLNEDGYQIIITFKNNIKSQADDLGKYIQLTISNVKKYSWMIKEIKLNKIILNIVMLENCKQESLKINLTSQEFIRINELSTDQSDTDLPTFIFVSEEQKEKTEKTKKAINGIGKVTNILGWSLAVSTGFTSLLSAADVTSYIYFLQYINIRYPYNVVEFSKIFKNFYFEFIPDLFQSSSQSQEYQSSPSKFQENGMDSYFMRNSGKIITFILIFLMTYIVFKCISRMSFIPRIQRFVQVKIIDKFEYGVFLCICWITYIYAAVSTFLQISIYQANNPISRFNYFVFSLALIAVVSLPLLFTVIIKKSQKIQQFKSKFNVLIGQFKIQDTINQKDLKTKPQDSFRDSSSKSSQQELGQLKQPNSSDELQQINSQQELNEQQKREEQEQKNPIIKYTSIMLYMRKLIFSIVLIFLHDHTIPQLVLLICMNVGLLGYFISLKPYKQNYRNIKDIVQEFLLGILKCIIISLKSDKKDQDEDQRINLGWAYIVVCFILLIICTFELLVELTKQVIQFIKKYKKQQSQVFPISSTQFETNKIRVLPSIPKTASALSQPQTKGQLSILSMVSNANMFIDSNNMINKQSQIDLNQQNLITLNQIESNQESPVRKGRRVRRTKVQLINEFQFNQQENQNSTTQNYNKTIALPSANRSYHDLSPTTLIKK